MLLIDEISFRSLAATTVTFTEPSLGIYACDQIDILESRAAALQAAIREWKGGISSTDLLGTQRTCADKEWGGISTGSREEFAKQYDDELKRNQSKGAPATRRPAPKSL